MELVNTISTQYTYDIHNYTRIKCSAAVQGITDIVNERTTELEEAQRVLKVCSEAKYRKVIHSIINKLDTKKTAITKNERHFLESIQAVNSSYEQPFMIIDAVRNTCINNIDKYVSNVTAKFVYAFKLYRL